jgi:hypothetical protein
MAQGSSTTGPDDSDPWDDRTLGVLVDAYIDALDRGEDRRDAVRAALVASLPGHAGGDIELRLAYVSAVLEEEGIEPLSAHPPRPGYPDRLRDLVLSAVGAEPAAQTKYARLTAWLVARPEDVFTSSFDEIETVLGFFLPPSSRRHAVHWHSADGSAVARAIHAAGRRVRHLDLREERLEFYRVP